MARTKGALNKRTRMALSEAEEGEFADGAAKTLRYLIATANDLRRDDTIRLQAANVLLPYLRPKLSAVENTSFETPRSEEEILAEIKASAEKNKILTM